MAVTELHYCSTLDSLYSPVIQNWVLCFSCDTSNIQGISEILRAGFKETVQQKPYLAGRLDREDKGPKIGRMKLLYPNNGNVELRFWVNELINRPEVWRHSYEELRQQGMPTRQLDPSLLVPPGGYANLASYPMAAQANFIPGGCLLDVCLNHSLVDGLGGAMAVRTWAKNCKDLQRRMNGPSFSDIVPYQTPTIESVQCANLVSSKRLRLPDVLRDHMAPQGEEVVRIQEDDTLWDLLGLQKGPDNTVTARGSRSDIAMDSAIFVASAESVKRLKAESTSSNAESNERGEPHFISSFDATAALLWRCILRARYSDLQEPDIIRSRLRIPIDVRQILGISIDYPGNVLLNSITEMRVESLIAEANRDKIAPKIRSSLAFSRDVNRATKAIKLSFVLPSLGARRPLFSDTTKQDLVITSWQDLTYYKDDWGPMFGSSGNPEFFRLPQGYLRGVCAIQPKREDKKTAALISLEPDQMDRLRKDKEFTMYFKLQAL